MHFLGFIENPLSHIYIHANVFIMPSLWEGLPLSVVEAQKCNVPCLVSDTITKECDIGMAEFLPLDVSIWQERILNIYKEGYLMKEVNKSKFSLEQDILFFKKIYRDARK